MQNVIESICELNPMLDIMTLNFGLFRENSKQLRDAIKKNYGDFKSYCFESFSKYVSRIKCLTKEETKPPVNGRPLLLNFLNWRQGRKKEEPGKNFECLFFNCFYVINLMFFKLRLVRFDCYLIFLGQ